MRAGQCHPLASGQRGVGLVELMVTMLVGAIIVGGVIALFNANRQTFRLQDNLSVAQESGSFAIDFIARDIRLAGYPGGEFMQLAVDEARSANDVAVVRAEVIPPAAAPQNVTYFDDRLAIVHQVDARVGGAVTCTGDAVPSGATVSNEYWVRSSADGTEGELMCQGFRLTTNGQVVTARVPVGNPQALISGVDSFQVLYGVDTTHDSNPNSPAAAACAQSASLPNRWINSTDLDTAALVGAAEPNGCSNMGQREWLRAIRIGLLVRTTADVDAVAREGQRYTVLDRTLDADNFLPIADGRVRRLFITTVVLRNSQGVTQ